MYVFKESEVELLNEDSPPRLELVGIVEPRAKINEMFRNGRHLERYFLNAHREYQFRVKQIIISCLIAAMASIPFTRVRRNAKIYFAQSR
jgi:hypothetical protein